MVRIRLVDTYRFAVRDKLGCGREKELGKDAILVKSNCRDGICVGG